MSESNSEREVIQDLVNVLRGISSVHCEDEEIDKHLSVVRDQAAFAAVYGEQELEKLNGHTDMLSSKDDSNIQIEASVEISKRPELELGVLQAARRKGLATCLYMAAKTVADVEYVQDLPERFKVERSEHADRIETRLVFQEWWER